MGPGEPPEIAEISGLARSRLRNSDTLDGVSLPGYATPPSVAVRALGTDLAAERAEARSWKLLADRDPSAGQMGYAKALAEAATAHQKLIKKKKVATEGHGEATGYRSPLKQTTYIYTSAYGFRADTRPPCELRCLGGFQPNAIRDERQDRIWSGKSVKKTVGLLDSFDHQANWGSDVSGFISVAHALPPALGFAELLTVANKVGQLIPLAQRASCYVYAVRARDAVDVAATFVKGRYDECEISVPGGIGWPDIVGWRKVSWRASQRNDQGELHWDSPIYLTVDREVLPALQHDAIVKVLSRPAEDVRWVDSKGAAK